MSHERSNEERPRVLDAILSTRTRAIGAIAAALLAASCSDDPATAPDGSTSVAPKVGSTYTLSRFNTDTSGVPLPGSGDTVVRTVVSTSAQYAGESSVHLFTVGSDTVRLRYASNGDVLYYPNWEGARAVGWLTLPIAAKDSSARTLLDTTYDIGGGVMGRNTVTLSVAYVSSEQMSVGASTLQAHKIRIRFVEVVPLTAESSITNTRIHTVWYSPAIGYFARVETGDSQENPFSTITTPTAVAVLTEYSLK
jgi:hypothetical protein